VAGGEVPAGCVVVDMLVGSESVGRFRYSAAFVDG
jgi:hypothetical protein